MKDKIIAIIEATIIVLFAMYLAWHMGKVQTVQAAPIAGAIKHLSDEQQAASLEAPVAGWQKHAIDVLQKPEQPKRKQKHDNYTYSSKQTLNPYDGVFYGPSGKESYYNMDMSHVVELMQAAGYDMRYWIRRDGVKMLGDYVMVAADLSIRPKGTVLDTSLGRAIVCDTGEFIYKDRYALDVAVAW